MQEIPFAFTTTAEAIGAVADDYAFVGPLTVEGHVVHTGSCWRAEGVIRCTKSYVCDRCLAPCQEEQEHPFSEEFRRTGEMADDEEANRFDGDLIDITELVRDTVLAAQPLSKLCKPDCKGLCPVCGADLNQGDCGCDRFVPDPRMAALQELLAKIRNETVRRCIRDGSTKAQNFEGTPRPAPCKLEARGSWLRSLPAVPRTEDASSCMPGMRLL